MACFCRCTMIHNLPTAQCFQPVMSNMHIAPYAPFIYLSIVLTMSIPNTILSSESRQKYVTVHVFDYSHVIKRQFKDKINDKNVSIIVNKTSDIGHYEK